MNDIMPNRETHELSPVGTGPRWADSGVKDRDELTSSRDASVDVRPACCS
jgi:hypothetical protein